VPHLNAAQRGIIGGALFAGDLGVGTADARAVGTRRAHQHNVRVGGGEAQPRRSFLVWDNARPLIEPKPKRLAAPVSDDEALVAIVERVGVTHALEVLARADVAIAA
jgi:hypothetical protein